MHAERVRKVAAIATRPGSTGLDLLVFDHPLDGGSPMVQVPAGTVESAEGSDIAALRELLEASSVSGRVVALAGVRDEEWQDESHERWVYLLNAPEGLPDEWPYTCDCGAAVRFYWVPSAKAELVETQQPWLDLARNWMDEHQEDVAQWLHPPR